MSSWPHGWDRQPDRSAYTTRDTIKHIWHGLGLPQDALAHIDVDLPSEDIIDIPSSFKIGHLAQASICLSALAASSIDRHVNNTVDQPRTIRVPLMHAVAEFGSEKHYLLDGKPAKSAWGTLGGLHKTADGHVRMHDNFPNHRNAICKVLELNSETATKEDVAQKTLQWKSFELERVALENDAVIFALRLYQEWETSGPGQAIMAGHSFPIRLTKIASNVDSSIETASHIRQNADRCLQGLRVLELSRVIAAPVAGKTLAAHGADVLWVTSPNLPSLPALDIDVGRGKRSIQLDIKADQGKQDLERLACEADVFIQSYRPGALDAQGFDAARLAELRPGIAYATLSAWDDSTSSEAPWAAARGFDSMVQTASGMNISEAEHFGDPDGVARPMPVQALDHAAGYFLATGICAALYKTATEGGSWKVEVSLAGVMKYLRSLGQYPGREGFECEASEDVSQYLETRTTALGELSAVKHSASIDGKEPGWDIMPKDLGSDKARWL